MIRGRATAEGTGGYAQSFAGRIAPDHFRSLLGLQLSSIGLGTYLGRYDDDTDTAYGAAIERALQLGCNVLDTAINYRCMRSERSIGATLQKLIGAGQLRRDQVVVATKGGFVPFDGAPPPDPEENFQRTYVDSKICSPNDLVAGCHCMTPAYLADQIRRSRENLGLETIDIYYLHNPETQRPEVGETEFQARLRAAFELFERKVAEGEIGVYGTATWDGYRCDPGEAGYLSLTDLDRLAREVGGTQHHFRAIQLPVNLALPEAFSFFNQAHDNEAYSTLQLAARLGQITMASASIFQSRLARSLPAELAKVFPGLQSDAQRALQFTRSTPGLTTALVGMAQIPHVEENLAVAKVSPVPEAQYMQLFQSPQG
jgi:aryl-alcohol dehydrogenase-like predicted oxidoreductase